ncbi:unnamed protein product, partial [Owenia fusiformis]
SVRPRKKMEQESDLIQTVQISSADAAVVLNGSIFPLNSLTLDTDKPEDLAVDKFDVHNPENLTQGGGVILDTRNGLVHLTVNEAAGTSLDQLNTTSKDLQQTVSLYTQEQLAAALSNAQLLEIANESNQELGDIGVSTVSSQNVLTLTSSQGIFTTARTNLSSSEHGYQIVTEKQKKKGGWPKGKKRKPGLRENNGPKAPMTGYTLYAVNRRKVIKTLNPEMKFTELTKIIGQEWTAMAADDKQKYLDEAEKDKKRYIEELEVYKHSDSYQTYLKRKKLKELCQDMDTSAIQDADLDPLSDSDNDELYCKICNQYFVSNHNKREHCLGKVHLQNLTGEYEREMREKKNAGLINGNGLTDEASNTADNVHLMGPLNCSPSSNEIDVNGFMMGFMQKNIEREKEIKQLKETLEESKAKFTGYTETSKDLKELESRLESDLENFQAYGAALQAQIDSLKMVPTLFGVINFAHTNEKPGPGHTDSDHNVLW